MSSWHQAQTPTDPPIWFFAWIDPFRLEEATACFGAPANKEDDTTKTPGGVEWCWKFVRTDGEELHLRVNEPAGLARLFSKSDQGIPVHDLPENLQHRNLQYLEKPTAL